MEVVAKDERKSPFGSIPTHFEKKLNSNHAYIGDIVIFLRKSTLISGMVVAYRKNIVVVEINDTNARLLGLENNLTVVNHKHYEIK